ncbi:ornithine carbamoyltransferase [Desulfuromonas acetoxidans]|uniref:Ornithine carbamoyltransferase n=1 Tax=Desulfuromonas acetoxidans (strain DSM 684 / 11070) TaxID=281689 RepID=Q1K3B5_DESA6|nr:ornithine carbamoyltransferase [Desulfuromonas acetoxidans]EAT17059.1 ornithine carbamoyltransferase [Desulfuromonas acetoxidans DSM 684]MBF0645130.1 ornithine carbamoyltransferase [Desulfuromonas acetoxidans]NVD24066.1 ornithine carbamoyltransferase [Desulfuromonas acetoxidans]NVE16362.1 ornithine carbamoyltransferase [Desulfuromonas acetoxidans]
MTNHFLCLTDWTAAELDAIFALTKELKDKQKQGIAHPLLAGKTLGMIFEKSSTRTRISFEVGMYQLGGHALFLSSSNTQLGRGEPIKDTARVMSRYVDGIMIRTFSQEGIEELARYADVPVINALTDSYHPCQVMADLFTVLEHKGSYKDQVYCWIGDGNNMAHSWINAAAVLGFELRVATPKGYEPDTSVIERAEQLGAKITYTNDPLQAAWGADVLNTDVWASMGQEQEQLQREKDFVGFQINAEVIDAADGDCLVLHCLPAHRGEEITDDVIEGRHSVVFDEAENRLHVQKAIMATLMNKE